MPKIYKIETRSGWYQEKERIANYDFPMRLDADFRGATEFFSKSRAEKTIKKYNLRNAHVEEFEWEPEKA